jgi:hypothetical protein
MEYSTQLEKREIHTKFWKENLKEKEKKNLTQDNMQIG